MCCGCNWNLRIGVSFSVPPQVNTGSAWRLPNAQQKPWECEQFSERTASLSRPRRLVKLMVSDPEKGECYRDGKGSQNCRFGAAFLGFAGKLIAESQLWALASRRRSPRLAQLADTKRVSNTQAKNRRCVSVSVYPSWSSFKFRKMNKHRFSCIQRQGVNAAAANAKLALAAGLCSTLARVESNG